MNIQDDSFHQFEQALADGGVLALLDSLDTQLRASRQYHDLFKSLQMRVRHQLGLPLLSDSAAEEMTDEQRVQLEDQLIDVCREIGALLVREGQIRDGWMYLRVVGDVVAAAEVLADVLPDENNLDELIEVLLQEGVDPPRGFVLVLEHFGTCDAITTFEAMAGRLNEEDRQATAGVLVEHLHAELVDSVVAHISEREGSEPSERSLRELVSNRAWLFEDLAYHVDTTHLAATLRAARCLEDERQLRLALDLTAYGLQLDSQYQYEGEEPFAETYPSHALYFAACLSENEAAAIQYFRDRAESLEVVQHGLFPMETLMRLLYRAQRYDEAIDTLIQLAEQESVSDFVTQWMLQLCRKTGRYNRFVDFCRSQGDLLGYALGLAHADEVKGG